MEGKYIETKLGSSFLLNAGICGFIKFLKHNRAEEGMDYEIDGQFIRVSEQFFRKNDIGLLYIDTVADIFEKNTKYYRICQAVKVNEDVAFSTLDEKQQKVIKDTYDAFADMLLKASYISAYEGMKEYKLEKYLGRKDADHLKKCKDLEEKRKCANEIIGILEQKRVKNTLIYTELLYGIYKLFFNENPTSKKIPCLCEAGKPYEKTYHSNFVDSLLNELEIETKKKNTRCIECLEETYNKKPFSFMVDSTDDVAKKKSAYWNCKPDAYVCPTCAFLYSFVPLGFAFLGEEAVFINENSNIISMYRMMECYREIGVIEKDTVRKRLFRTLTTEKIHALHKRMSNIQVVIRSKNYSHFKFDVIDKNIVEKLYLGRDYFGKLEKVNINLGTADKSNWISVYDSVFDCITSHNSLYRLIDIIVKNEISAERDFTYVENIVKLQNIFYGGVKMDELNKKVDAAFMAGKKLREAILGKNDAKKESMEDDNRLRSIVYRLVNLATVGDCSQYVDSVIRIYAGFNLTIPSVFKECYKSEEMFQAIAHGFILGLKYVKYEEEKKND